MSLCKCKINKKCLWNMYAPNNLDLWPRNPKVNRGHLLVMTNHHTKLEDPWAMSSLVIDRTRFVYGLTYRPTNQGIDMCKAIYPSSLKGGIISFSTHRVNMLCLKLYTHLVKQYFKKTGSAFFKKGTIHRFRHVTVMQLSIVCVSYLSCYTYVVRNS